MRKGHPLGERLPWGLKNIIFSGFIPLNYVFQFFTVCVLKLVLLCGRTEEACSTVVSLRKVDISHPTGHYIHKKKYRAPLRKSWVRFWVCVLEGSTLSMTSCCFMSLNNINNIYTNIYK